VVKEVMILVMLEELEVQVEEVLPITVRMEQVDQEL
tara:strand:+ start:201 stop:308 length:108 start_codon:yes stop_codon:yes gene_type:complete